MTQSIKSFSARCGNHWRIVRAGRAVVSAALLVGLVVPGWTPIAQAQSTEAQLTLPQEIPVT